MCPKVKPLTAITVVVLRFTSMNRVLFYPYSDHMRGFIERGMGRACLVDVSDEFREGYNENRSYFLSIATACDRIELVKL